MRRGWDVELFEWSRVLGGRAASIFEPVARHWIDNGQHLFMGCCTEQLDLNRRLGLSDLFQRSETISFTGASERRWQLSASHYLPGRWQLVPSFLKNPYLSFKERLATGLLIRKLFKINEHTAFTPSSQFSSHNGSGNIAVFDAISEQMVRTISFGEWLRKEGASEETIERFWSPLIYSALSDSVDAVCLFAAKKVVKDGFMSGREAMSLYYPKCPLREIYHIETQRKLEQLGVRTHFYSRIDRLRCEEVPSGENDDHSTRKSGFRVRSLCLNNGGEREFDRFVLAIPAYRACQLLDDSGLSDFTDTLGFDRFELGAITAVHLWFDRPILPSGEQRTAILDGPGQWLFFGEHLPVTQLNMPEGPKKGFYHQIIISASHRVLEEEELVAKGRESLLQRILEQLRQVFPSVFSGPNATRLLHYRATTVFDAVFSPRPELYRFRPLQQTPLDNLVLAGDWTQTDWPATMEGAIRSGRRAVELLDTTEKTGNSSVKIESIENPEPIS